MADAIRKKIDYLRNNAAAWIEVACKISNKDLKLVKFVPNKQQRTLLDMIEKYRYVICCKQRQNGMSSIVMAYALYKCLTTPRYNVLMMSYRGDSISGIWGKLKDIYLTIPEAFSYPLANDNKNQLKFKNGSRIVCAVCGNKSAMQGNTFSMIHISEASLAEKTKLKTQIQGIQPSLVADGIFIIESTPQLGLTPFAEMFMDAENGKGLFHPVFFSWLDDLGEGGMHHKEQMQFAKAYVKKHGRLPVFEELNDEEKDLYFRGCGYDILAWRRIAIEQGQGIDGFRQNYPVDSANAFLSNNTNAIFDTPKIQARLIEIRDIETIPMPDDLPEILVPWYNNGLKIWAKPELYWEQEEEEQEQPSKMKKKAPKKPPQRRLFYAGVDSAEGLGGKSDYSVVEIIDENCCQVAEFRSNKVKPYKFAELVNALGLYFNEALLVVEKEASGLSVLERLHEEFGYWNLFRSREPDTKGRRKYGFTTREKSKRLLVNQYLRMFENDELTIYSKQLLTEMLAFSYVDGRMEALTGHDDTCMAFGFALVGWKNDPHYCLEKE